MLSLPDGMLDALSRPESTQTISGRITLADGTTRDLPSSSLLAGSTTISMQCGETGEVHIGGAYIGEMKTTILHPDFDRTLLKDATVTLTAGVATPGGMQDIQLGVWTVSSASWSRTGVELTCYDNMSKLDTSFTGTAKEGEPYAWLSRACQACGVRLGVDESTVQGMPNGLGVYTLGDKTTNVKTWRDLVQWVCQIVAGFAYAGADGSIMVARYAGTPCRTIPGDHRTQDTTLEAYESVYTGITLTIASDGITEYHTRDHKTDTGLTQNLGQNPLLQDLGKTVRHDRLLRIVDAIPASTPGSITIMEPPVHTLGDMLALTGGYAGTSGSVRMLVQRIEYQAGKGTTYSGYGADPALATARSKTDKNVEGLLGQTKADEWYSTPFGVERTITVGSDRTLVSSVTFAVKERDTIVDVHAQTLLDVTLPTPADDGTTTAPATVLTCTWTLDGAEYDFQPVETYAVPGRHVLHLYLAPKATANITHRIDLYMQAAGGSCTIQSGWLMGLLEGKGLAGDAGWNGRIDIDETFPNRIGTGIDTPLPRQFSGAPSPSLIVPTREGLAETVSRISLTNVATIPVSTEDMQSLHPGVESLDAVHQAMESWDATTGAWAGGIFNATKQATLTSWLMGTDQTITGITGITPVDAPDTAAYQLSWDGGTTWGAVDDHGTWTVDATMTGSRMAALDQAQYAAWYTPPSGVMLRVTLQAGTTLKSVQVAYRLSTSTGGQS